MGLGEKLMTGVVIAVLAGGLGTGVYYMVKDMVCIVRANQASYTILDNDVRFDGMGRALKQLASSYVSKVEDGDNQDNLNSATMETATLYLELKDKGLRAPLTSFESIIESLAEASEKDETLNSLSSATNMVVRHSLDYTPAQLSAFIGTLDKFYNSENDDAVGFAKATVETIDGCKEIGCDLDGIRFKLEDIIKNSKDYASYDFSGGDSIIKVSPDRGQAVWHIRDNLSVSSYSELFPNITALVEKLPEETAEAAQASNLEDTVELTPEKQPVLEEVAAEESYEPIALQQYAENAAYYNNKKVEISAYPVSQSMLDSTDSYALTIMDDSGMIDCIDNGLTNENLKLFNAVQYVIDSNRETVDVKKVTVFGKITGEELELDAVEANGKRRELR
ncbi:MAG: hypothetical protein ABIB71_08890 [Candidatus Woesearchaeota archaeon]